LIPSKIVKTVATRCQILKEKCVKFRFRLGLSPRPFWGANSLQDVRGILLREMEGEGGIGRESMGEKERNGIAPSF